MTESSSPLSASWWSKPQRPGLVAGAAVLAALLFATYFTTLRNLAYSWWQYSDEYGHGFLVPVFAGFLLWLRRDMIKPWPDRGSLWCIAFFAAWAGLRWFAAFFSYALDQYSIFPCLAGIVLLLGGWRALHWAWPAIAYLVFMVPLPGVLAGGLSQELQAIGTRVSVFAIQTLGVTAYAEGNIINLQETQLQVVEACSGLRMLMLFFAICVGAVLVLRDSPWWEKTIIILSAPPIAIFANVVRITVTALLHHMQMGELADKVFHDMAGLLMMPIALVVLWAEISLLHKLFIDMDSERPLTLE